MYHTSQSFVPDGRPGIATSTDGTWYVVDDDFHPVFSGTWEAAYAVATELNTKPEL